MRYEIFSTSHLKRWIWKALGLILLVSSCATEPQQKTKSSPKPKVKIEVPTFSADSAYVFI
jgi:PBP1b-binding outer membrane lipoprotein LpoB